MASQSSEPAKPQSALPFDPSPYHRQHTPLFNRNLTPRYLYRLVAPQTAGSTTTSTVVLPTAIQHQTDIFHLPTQNAATLLLNHLLWERGHEDGCNLMSWTSSLLFAFQYALYRHRKDGDDLNQIQLIILDTTLFPRGTFMQDMEIMRSFAASDSRLQRFVEFRESKYYFGEYISQGRLSIQNRCACTSVQKMIDLGLFQLLADRTQCWPKRVLAFREQFTRGKLVPTPDFHVETAVDISRQCFGRQWAVPVAIMLLALLPRKADDTTLMEGFKARFTGKTK